MTSTVFLNPYKYGVLRLIIDGVKTVFKRMDEFAEIGGFGANYFPIRLKSRF